MTLTLRAGAACLMLWAALPAQGQSFDELKNDAATPGDVLTYGMGYDLKRYSTLGQITRENVGRLVPVWAYSLNDDRGQESFPLVHDGVMYVTTHKATMAVDALTGRQIWKTLHDYPAEAPRSACCGLVNRGVAIWNGKVYRGTIDAHVIALDAKTGEEVWRTKLADFSTGYSITVAPLVAGGVLISGISGGEYGARLFLEGLDLETGKQLWRTYTIPGPGEPGFDTWADGGEAWKFGGGATWLTGSYDPELDTVYWGVGNAGPFNAGVRPGDNLYTGGMIAIEPKTGKIKWHYQFSPNDPFDYDGTNDMTLAEIDGRKVLMHADRNGFLYVIDRTNGELIAASQFVDKVNWASGIDLATGRPIETEVVKKARAGEEVEVWPSAFGGKNWAPMAYDPATNTIFAHTFNWGMTYKAVEAQYRAGTFYLGAEYSWNWPEDNMRGYLRAIDPMTGKTKWKQGSRLPYWGGVLATAGGVLFTGALSGEFEAYDAATGAKLWQFQTGSGIEGQPITWEHEGRQYVAVTSGMGGGYALYAGDEALANMAAGGMLWTFALPGE
ncbi:MAG TPA: PQQ-dependent dehydrogenase, methanol/ethanol family [Paracoccaceae bacterium]|nr:PQQ-dependent dehydrogenase, methanol/ethanol family [Paracoccaceae bacterium]